MRNLPDTLNAKQQKFVADMGLIGISPDNEAFWNLWDGQNLGTATERKAKAREFERRNREAEFVFAYITMPQLSSPYRHLCKRCNREFTTNYLYNKHCSESCLRASLEAVGLTWDPEKSDEERWHSQPPSTIAPETLERLKKWAHQLISTKAVYEPAKPAKASSVSDTSSQELISAELSLTNTSGVLTTDSVSVPATNRFAALLNRSKNPVSGS